MIPSLVEGDVGPLATMAVAAFSALVVGLVVLPWTVARNRSHLRVRGQVTLALLAMGAVLAAVAAFVPSEVGGRRCDAALPSQGVDLDALATMDGDGCAVAGQLLVVFAGSIVLAEIIGVVAWFASRDPVLDAPDVREDGP